MPMLRVTQDDLVKVRFAYRPLMEIPLSYRVLINPNFQSPYLSWINEAYRALFDADLPYLHALVPDHGYIPDFLTPTPRAKLVDIEADFDELLATPDVVIQKGISTLIATHGDSEIRRFFLIHTREAMVCLIDDLRLYWRRTIGDYWSRMISILEGDLLYRARQLALDGPTEVFNDLHPSVSYQNDYVQIRPACQHLDSTAEFSLSGDGIQLVPVIFRGCGRMYQIEPEWASMLAYGVRGAGLWQQQPAGKSLEKALGTARARVLQTLTTPATTGEVAVKARITAGTASQHLGRLTEAGLIEPRRVGKRVYYHLTRRGEDLIALFERMY